MGEHFLDHYAREFAILVGVYEVAQVNAIPFGPPRPLSLWPLSSVSPQTARLQFRTWHSLEH
jgi:hypothetical protein